MSESPDPISSPDQSPTASDPPVERLSTHLLATGRKPPRSVVVTDDPPSVVGTTNTALWAAIGLIFAVINGILIAQLFSVADQFGPPGWIVGVLVASLLAGLVAAWWLPRFIGVSSFRVDQSTFSYQPNWGSRVTASTDHIAKLGCSNGQPTAPGLPEAPGCNASVLLQGPDGSQRIHINYSAKLIVDAIRWFKPDVPVERFVHHPTDKTKVYHAWREMLLALLSILWLIMVTIEVLPNLTN